MGFTFPNNPGGYVAPTVPLVMFLWIPVVIYLFSRFPARKALVISFLTAWLFLPEARLELPGVPDYDKTSATCYGILLATFIFDVGRFQSFRFSWVDVPMAVWCLCPFVSSMTNDLGPYDGFSSVLDQTMTWGIPYFLGRIYMNSWEGLRQLAIGIFAGGLIYVPLCLFEMRFSPQLHRIVYGSHAGGDFGQTVRLGGFRPTVFMIHGLGVGAFMMAATLIGIWLWQSGTLKKLWGIQIQWLVASLFITFLLIRSTGAYTLLFIGLLVLLSGRFLKTSLPIFLILGAITAYLYVNAETETYFTDQLIDYLSNIFPPERLESLEFRFNNEELLTDHARERIWFGWSGWGRSRVPIEPGSNQLTVQDSLWVIAFGQFGTVGLVSLFTGMLLPVAALCGLRCPGRVWGNPKFAPAAVMSVMVILYMIDCILNAIINPLYILASGGIAGTLLNPGKVRQIVSRAGFATSRNRLAQSR